MNNCTRRMRYASPSAHPSMAGPVRAYEPASPTPPCNMPDKAALLSRLQELEFAITDTALYLDMYPGERRALLQYKKLSEERDRVYAAYEAQVGPLTMYGVNEESWDWTGTPLPWEQSDRR